MSALGGVGSEGIGLRQFYTVTMANTKTGAVTDLTQRRKLYAVPTYVGSRTMPDSATLTEAQDSNDTTNFVSASVSGFHVNSIVIELTISMIIRSGTALTGGRPERYESRRMAGGLPLLARVFNAVYSIPIPSPNRADLLPRVDLGLTSPFSL